jgi:hypothetical protein
LFADDAELNEAFDAGAAWVRKAPPPSEEPSEAEEQWFGSLAYSSLLVERILERVADDGRLLLRPGEDSEVFLRFHLFSELVQVLQNRRYSWVSAIDTYSRPWWSHDPIRVAITARVAVPFAELAALARGSSPK